MLAKRTVLGLTAGVCRLAGEVLSEAAGVGGGDGAAGQLHVDAEGLQDAEDLAVVHMIQEHQQLQTGRG